MKNCLVKRSLLAFAFALVALGAGAAEKTPAEQSATKPTEAEITAAVKAAFERKASGINEAHSVEIKSIKIGKVSRPWAHPADVASVGYQIWTAKVDYLLRWHYNTRTVVYEHDTYFDLSVNTLGEWIIQTSSQPGSTSTALPDEPARKP